jgi:ABC-type transporter Mla subunit MlaD
MAAKVRIKAEADTSDAKQGFDELGGHAESRLDSIATIAVAKGQLIAEGIALGIRGVRAAFGQLAQFGAEAVAASNAQENAVKSLNVALATAGDLTVEASQDMQEFASRLQEVTTIGDETTLELLALAKSFGATNEQAKLMVQAAADFSSEAQINLEEAMRRIGRATQGSIEDIAKFVPELKNLTKEQLAAGEGTKLLAERFEGAAAAAADTFGGKVEQLNGVVGDVKEKVGDLAKVALEPLVDILKQAAKDTDAWIAAHKADAIDTVTRSLSTLAQGIAGVVSTGAQFTEFFGEIRAAFARFMDKALKPVLNLLNRFATFAETVRNKLGNQSDKLDEWTDALRNLSAGLEANVEDQEKYASKLGATAAKAQLLADKLANDVANALNKVGRDAKSSGDEVERMAQKYQKAKDDALPPLEEILKKTQEIRDRMGEAGEAGKKMGAGIAKGAAKGAQAVQQQTAALDDMLAKLKSVQQIGGTGETVDVDQGDPAVAALAGRFGKLGRQRGAPAAVAQLAQSAAQQIRAGDIGGLMQLIQSAQTTAGLAQQHGSGGISQQFAGIAQGLQEAVRQLRLLSSREPAQPGPTVLQPQFAVNINGRELAGVVVEQIERGEVGVSG